MITFGANKASATPRSRVDAPQPWLMLSTAAACRLALGHWLQIMADDEAPFAARLPFLINFRVWLSNSDPSKTVGRA